MTATRASQGVSRRRRVKLPRSLTANRAILICSGAVVVVAVMSAVLAPIVAPHDPLRQELEKRLLPPFGFSGATFQFPLGTDPFGRDMLSRLVYGARISLVVGFSAVVLQGLIGLVAGLLAGFYGGWVDRLVTRTVDIQLGIPFLVLAIAVSVVLGNGLTNLIITLTITGWVTYARIIRASALSLREREYVTAAYASGSTSFRIIFRHLLPNLVGLWLVVATFQVTRMIIAESSLSFLGLGIDPATPSWGGMAADGRDYLSSAWWVATVPGLAIAVLSLSVNLLGDWLRDVLDPTTQIY